MWGLKNVRDRQKREFKRKVMHASWYSCLVEHVDRKMLLFPEKAEDGSQKRPPKKHPESFLSSGPSSDAQRQARMAELFDP